MSKKLFLLVFLLVLAESVSAATIYGSVYDLSLDKLEDVKLEIDTEPKQTYVSKDGSYEFTVPKGTYTIAASHYSQGVVEAADSEQISVTEDGSFVLDLVLFPELDEQSGLIDEGDEISLVFDEEGGIPAYIWFAGLFVLGMIFYFLSKNIKPKKEVKSEGKPDLDKVIEVIKQEGGRTTQKEIRKHFPLSEAKISLMITELEHKGVVQRIKKGRGNVVILKKST